MFSPSKLAVALGSMPARQPSSAFSASIWRRCSAVEMANSPPTWRGERLHYAGSEQQQLADKAYNRGPQCFKRERADGAWRVLPCSVHAAAIDTQALAAAAAAHLDGPQLEAALQREAHVADHPLQAVMLVRGAHLQGRESWVRWGREVSTPCRDGV